MVKKCKKPSLGPHYGRVQNPISTFTAAYAFIQNHPGKIYTTRPRNGNGKDFEAFATVSQKGKRKGWQVINFKTAKSEAKSYKKCWGHMTNISGVHIHMYTSVIR